MINSALDLCDCVFPLSLPKEARILVEEGRRVLKGEILAEKEIEEFQEFDLARFFSVAPKKVETLLLVSPGAKIGEEQIIAVKRGFLGKETIFRSPVSGVFFSLSEKGVLKIKTKSSKEEIVSPVCGKIDKVGENFLILRFSGIRIEGSWGSGGKVFGILDILGEREEEVGISRLKIEDKRKILVIGGKISLGIINKAEALEVAGLVGGAFSSEVKNGEMVMLSFNDESGFIPKEVWQELEKRKGREVFLSGEEKFLCFPKNL